MEPYETFTWQQKETNTANYLKKRNKYFRLNNYIIITLFLTCSIIGAFFSSIYHNILHCTFIWWLICKYST